MADILLYHASPSRSSTVLWMLEETGVDYDVKVLNLKAGDSHRPDYLAINPMGKVPALRYGDVVITETAAICTWLADRFPAAGLAPAIDDPQRGPWLKWMFFGPSCLEPVLIDAALKRDSGSRTAAGWGDHQTVVDVLASALSAGPWLMGAKFSAADVVIGSGLRWGMMFKGIPDLPAFTDYVARLNARPAARLAMEKDAALAAA